MNEQNKEFIDNYIGLYRTAGLMVLVLLVLAIVAPYILYEADSLIGGDTVANYIGTVFRSAMPVYLVLTFLWALFMGITGRKLNVTDAAGFYKVMGKWVLGCLVLAVIMQATGFRL